MKTSDFDPLVRSGVLEKASTMLGLRRRRADLPVVENGHALVLVDRNGGVRSAEALTAGERFWAAEGTWQIIDVSSHEIHCDFDFTSTDGTAGYVIDVEVLVRVTDADEAVRRKARAVSVLVRPKLRSSVERALPNPREVRGGDTVTNLNAGRAHVASALRQALLGEEDQTVDGWLAYRVTDVTVTFDAATRTHLDTLVSQHRTSEIDVRELRHRLTKADAEIDLRNKWAAHLTEQLSEPVTRAVAAAASDPTPANIAVAVEQLNSDEQWTRAEVVTILKTLIEKNYVGDLGELETIKVIVEGLQRTGTARAPAAVEAGAAAGGQLIEGGEIVTPAPTARGDGGDTDKNWN